MMYEVTPDLWVVTYVAPAQESAFIRWGQDFGCAMYAPQASYWTKPKGKKQPILLRRPAFPGYVFVKFTSAFRARMQQSSTLLYILQSGEEYCFRSNEFIESLKIREERGDFNVKTPGSIQLNDVIELLDGPFAGEIARVKQINKKQSVTLEVKGLTLKLALAKFIDSSYKRVSEASSDLVAPHGERQLEPSAAIAACAR